MTRDEVAHGLDTRDRPGLESPRSIVILHQPADGLPLLGADTIAEAPVRDDLNVAVGHLHIDEDTVVVGGVPNAQLPEHVERPRSRVEIVEYMQWRQGSFDRETDFAAVRRLGALDRPLDGIQSGPGELAAGAQVGRE